MNLEKCESAKAQGLLYMGFNQDQGCFAVGLENGFRVYNVDPLKEKLRKDFDNGGIAYVEMLFRCNYLALVGGGKNPKYPPNKVIIWDEAKGKCVMELEFKSEVKAVKLRRDRIVTVLKNKVIVHSFTNNPQKLNVFETWEDNDNGICALCSHATNAILAFPGKKKGQVQTVDIGEAKKTSSIITAHEAEIRQIAMNLDGTKIATASKTGTLIRVFSVDGQKLHELRRGSDPCEIFSLNFNPDSTRLCVSSEKGTIHCFYLDSNKNRTSSFVALSNIVPYFASEWSVSQFKVNEPYSMCAFGTGPDRNSIIVVCGDGSHSKFTFDSEKPGDGHRETYNKFLRMTDDL